MGISGNEKLKLKRGYTTGSCATAAAKAAAIMLLSEDKCDMVSLLLPKGLFLCVEVLDILCSEQSVSCAVQKDSGDDPDITDKVLVYAKVEIIPQQIVIIDGGMGVGRVTKSGLDRAVGESAINTAPRKSIEKELTAVAEHYSYNGGFRVTISVPDGERLAQKTFNPRLGIVGGISVLGTTGIVEPMSEAAIVDTIRLEMRVRKAEKKDIIIMTFGNYGEEFLESTFHVPKGNSFQCSNFVGEALEYAVELKLQKILIVGHIGKLVKLAGGIMQTHSKYADCRMEILTTHAAINGADTQTCREIMTANTTDDAVKILQKAGLLELVMNSVMRKIKYYIDLKIQDVTNVEIVMFSNKFGILALSENAKEYTLKAKGNI